MISFIQVILAFVGLALLFGTPWAYYQVYGQIGYYYGYRYYSVWYNAPSNAAMGLLTVGFAVLLIFVALFGLGWGWLSSSRAAEKYAKLTMVFGLLVIVLSAVAAAVVTAQEKSLYPDVPASNVSWSLSTALTGFLIGGLLFMAIGFIGTLMTKPAQVPPSIPSPLPPPPPPPSNSAPEFQG
jgi:glucan phosphoethanolaminetransferase (alkaline phosphatase superfamily)